MRSILFITYLLASTLTLHAIPAQTASPGKNRATIAQSSGSNQGGFPNKLIAERSGRADLVAHHNDFFACIRGHKAKPNADVQAGHYGSTIVHLANICARLGEVVQFDPKAETIVGNADANAMVGRVYRPNHWAAPKA